MTCGIGLQKLYVHNLYVEIHSCGMLFALSRLVEQEERMERA